MLPANAAIMSALEVPRWSVFFLMQTASGPVRAWLGVGDYDLPPDDVDEPGGTYLGIGLVGDIPAINQLVGGLAERVEFALNGVDDRVISLADDEADGVVGASVHVGIIFFDEDWQAVDPVSWLWCGTADRTSVTGQASEQSHNQSVTVSVGSAFTDRTRPRLSYYTDVEQRSRSSDDSFCSRVARYAINSTVTWPAPD